jgi:phospholipid N-methyltransferase
MLDRAKIDQMREQLRTGVRTVSAPQLFPTPIPLAERMASMADIHPGMTVLEPSAGTGRLLDAILKYTAPEHVGYMELNYEMFRYLFDKYAECHGWQGDFLESPVKPVYDRVVMNPPFKNGEDIKHIKHALSMLRPGGWLVALCAGGPRQRKELEPLADYWEDLPPGTFSDEGTGVNVCLLVIEKGNDVRHHA